MPLYEETKNIQKELNDKFISDDPLKYIFNRISIDNESRLARGLPMTEESAPPITGKRDSRNYSRFFGEIYSPTPMLEDETAHRQSTLERGLFIIPRITVKVLSEVAQMPGYLGGLVAWGTTGFAKEDIGLMVNNFWQRGIQQAEETTKNTIAPVFVSDEVKNGNLFENIFSSAFWATEGADGVGFLLSFLVPGQVFKTAGVGAKVAKLIKPGTAFAKLIKGEVATAKLAETLDFFGAASINTVFESAAEGGETYRNVLDKTGDKNKAGIAAADVVNKNFGILLASNLIDQYWLFKDINLLKGTSDPAKKVTKKVVLDKLFDPKTGKKLSEIAYKTGWEKAGILTKDFLMGIGKEGFYEEGMQYAASKHAEDKSNNPEEDDRGFLNELVDIGETYLDNLSNTEMQKSIFLGGLLGGGMSMIHTAREDATIKRTIEGSKAKEPSAFGKFFGMKERKATPGLKQLLESSWGSRYNLMSDLAETTTDKDGNIIQILEEDGTYKLDPKKVESLVEDKLLDYMEKEKLIFFARTGNEEGFKYLKEKLDHRYMSTFLQQEGGLGILLKHIEELAEADKENMAKEGIDMDLSEIKKDLTDKAIKFQKMYDRVNSTHDMLMDNVKFNKEDKATFKDYSNEVRNSKLDKELKMGFYDSRISSLRKELADTKYNDVSIPIITDSDNLSEKLISELKESHKENKDKLSDATNKHIEKVIGDLEKHQKSLKEARDYSEKLYDKKWLNTTFAEYKSKKKEATESPIDGNKAKEALPLGSKLKALYNKAVIMEEIDLPTKAVARHSGEIEISYLDKSGNIHKAYGTIVGTTNTGNIQMNIHKTEVTNEETKKTKLQNVEDDTIYFLNENETFHYKGENYEIKNLNITKSPEDVQRERQNNVMLQTLKDTLTHRRDFIKNINEEISVQQDYIQELQDKLEQLKEKEAESISKLTKQGTTRKQSVMVARGKNRVRMFLDTQALNNEINKAKNYLTQLKEQRIQLTNDKVKLNELIKQAKKDGNFLKVFAELSKNTDDLTEQADLIVDKTTELISDSEVYLKRLYSTLKGYHTTFGNVLGISNEINQIRTNPDLNADQIDQAINGLIVNLLNSGFITEEQYEALGILPENLERLQELIQKTNQELNDNKVLLDQQKIKLKELGELNNVYKSINTRFNNNYLDYLNKILSVLEDIVDDKINQAETPEDTFDNLSSEESAFIRKHDEEYRHIFYDENSWLVSSGNQEELMRGVKNDDASRWYIFVNKLSHERNTDKQNKYIFKSFTVKQVGALKQDNIIRKRLKFYAGVINKEVQLVTYDQLQKLPIANQEIASEDIKMVVYERDGKPLTVSHQVIGKEDEQYYIVYNSFIENQTGQLNFDRFSIEKAVELRLQEKKYPTPYTEDQIALTTKEVKKSLEDSWNKFQETRTKMKEQSYYFEIDHINPGVKVLDNSISEVLEVVGTNDIQKIADNLKIHIQGTRKGEQKPKKSKYKNRITRKLSWTEHSLLSGYLYLQHDNRFERIQPRTLEETASVEDVINIIRFLATNPENYAEIEQYLHKILYINAKNKEFRIFFTKFYGADNTKHGFRSLVFGLDPKTNRTYEITAQELFNGEKLDDLRTFLGKKYWNFDEKSLEETTFTEYKVNWNNGKPKITSKLWGVKDGAYAGFLFSPIQGSNIPKGTINIKKHASNLLESTRSPQYINQSVALINLGTEFKNAPKQASEKNAEEGVTKKKGNLRSKVEGIVTEKKKGGLREKAENNTKEEKSGVSIKVDSAVNTATPGMTETPFTTKEEYWASFSKEERDRIVAKFPNKNETELQDTYFTLYKFTKNSTDTPNRYRQEIDLYLLEDFNNKKKWFQNKFPQIPIKQLDKILMEESWGRLTKNGHVLISSDAPEGTVYHEAYHTYSLLFLEDDQRIKLYNEVRTRLGNATLSDKKAEEFLAEEFREYMNAPNSYKFNKGEELRKDWFQRLLDYIISILQDWNILKSKKIDAVDFQIEANFKKINETNFFLEDNAVLMERVKNLRNNYNRSRILEGFSEKETMYIIQDFNYHFFQLLFDPSIKKNQDSLFDLDVNLTSLYSNLEMYYDIKRKTTPSAEKIYQNFNQIKEQHKDFVKYYKISLNERDLLEEEIEGSEVTEDDKTNNSTEYRDSISIDMNSLLDNPIRLVIAGLPSVTLINNIPKPTVSEFGTRSAAKYSDILTVLSDNMATLTSFEEMVDKLTILTKEYPEFLILLKRLGVKNFSPTETTTQQMNLQSQFYKNFARNKNNPKLLNYSPDGKKYELDALEDNINIGLNNEWLNNARNLSTDKESYIYANKTGDYLIKLKTLQKDLEYWDSLPKERRLDSSLTILDKLGIDLHGIVYDYETINNYIYWLRESLKDKTEKFSINDLYNRDIIRNQKEVKKLLDLTAKSNLNKKDLSYFNQDGNREYSVTMNSHLSNTVNSLNRILIDRIRDTKFIPEDIQHLMPYDTSTELGSLFNTNSSWIEQLLNGEKIELVLLKGLVSPADGVEISKTVSGDYKSITINALLNGIVPFLRSADRKLEYGFRIGTPNYNITDEMFKKAMISYLEDELRTSFALLIDPKNWGGNLVHYSKNAQKLRVFSFLHENSKFPELREYFDNHKNLEYVEQEKNNTATIIEANRITKNFLKSYNKLIDKELTTYLQDIENMTKESLLEDNLIRSEISGGSKKSTRYYIPGIDTEVLHKIGIKSSDVDKTISTYDMDRIIRIMSYNSFVGNNEQLKLFLGDLAFYKNAIDFHKRTTGASSTKYNQRDDIEIREHLNIEYRRFDNKKRTNSMSLVVVNDIITSNSNLKDLFDSYNESNGTDAQSWMHLDEYRDIMLRHGIWYPKHERTYQWEMQQLATRLIKLSEGGKKFPLNIDNIRGEFTSPKGMFYKHTNGIIPTTPMYLGTELKESNLIPLNIIKPQGFGHIDNIKGLNATEFWKTSAAPIMLSAIEDDSPMFDFLLNMIANQQSVFTFQSSVKQAEIIGDEKGTIQDLYSTDQYVHQDLRYRDFGIQLDIHEESEGEVSVSSQRTRLEFLDIFNRGIEEKNEKLVANRHEYTYLTNELEQLLRSNLLNELGIIYNEEDDTYSLPDKNREQFKKRLISAFENRQLPLNVVDGLSLALDSSLKVFDLTLSKFKIEEVITSIVKNKLIKRKIDGEMLIQESSFLYENPNSSSRLLEFYERTFPNGKNKKPIVTPMEVMIAVPRSLLEFVDDIGGLKVLNTAIAENNIALLGEDFFKMLTIPANRIPGQSLSSLDIIKIKKFLPHYHGSKIVIPVEATTKTGSDFDVDKLTVYFSNFKYIDKKLVYNRNLDSIGGKQNRLNELANESLLDPERFIELMTPIDTKYLKKKAKEIKSNKKNISNIEQRVDDPQLKDVIHWWYNMQKGYEFWTSKSGVAAVAVQNAAHAIEQNHSLQLNNVMPIFFDGQQLDLGENYSSGFIKDSSGRFISHNFAEFLSAFVDAVKDPFIFEVTDNETFNAIAALNRFGKNASVGMDSIIEFYSQDVIKNFIRLKKANSGRYMYFNQYNISTVKWSKTRRLNKNKQYATILRNIKNELNPSKEALIPIDYSSSVAFALEEYLSIRNKLYTLNEELVTQEEFTDETGRVDNRARHEKIKQLTDFHPDVIKAKNEVSDRTERYGYKYLSLQDLKNVKQGKLNNDELFKMQVQILDNYMMYNQFGWNIVNLNSFLRPDASSSFNRHLSSISASIIVPEQTIKRRGLIDFDSVLYAIAGRKDNPSLIREFFESKQRTPEFFRWSSIIQKNKVIRDFFESEVYSIFGNPNRHINNRKLESALEVIESDFITFLSTKLVGNMTTVELRDFYKALFMGNNSMAKQLLKIKNKITDNLALNELQPLISKKINSTQTISEIDNISLFSKNFDPSQWDALEADIFDLSENSTTNNNNFVKGLLLLSNFQSGYKKSPISFHEIIPNRILIPMMDIALGEFTKQDEATQKKQLYSFIEQMYRNNTEVKEIVPRNSYMVDFEQVVLRDKNQFHKNTNYVSANFFLGDYKEYKRLGRKVPIGLALYKRISPTEFELVSRQGDGIRFREYYPDATPEEINNISILDYNSYSYNLDNSLDATEDERVPKNRDYSEDEVDDDSDTGLYWKPVKSKSKPKRKSNRSGYIDSDFNDAYVVDEPNEYIKLSPPDGKTKLQILLRMIENRSETPSNIALARLLREELRIPIDVELYDSTWRDNKDNLSPEGAQYNGYYDFNLDEKGIRKIRIGLFNRLDTKGFENTTLHEGLHGLTIDRYYKISKFRFHINNLVGQVRNYINTTNILDKIDLDLDLDEINKTVLNDPKEFISYGLSNKAFQQLLATIPAYEENNINPELNKSLFKEFLEAIYELFESFFNRNPQIEDRLSFSAFAELVSLVDTALKTPIDQEVDFIDDFSSPNDIRRMRQNYSTAFEEKNKNKQNNKFELNKEDIEEFIKLYPQYSYLTPIEQNTFQEAIDKGEIQLACGL